MANSIVLERGYHLTITPMKTSSEDIPIHSSRLLLRWSFLLLAWLPVHAAYAEPKPPEKIKVAIIGTVVRSGAYPLDPQVTIEAAFKAAGGWNGRGDGGIPPKWCSLRRKNSLGVYESFKISVRIDRITKVVEVTDPAWKNQPLAATCSLELWEVIT